MRRVLLVFGAVIIMTAILAVSAATAFAQDEPVPYGADQGVKTATNTAGYNILPYVEYE